MENTEVLAALDAIEQENFLLPTFIASGHETVKQILSEMPEVRLLIARSDVGLPLIQARYQQKESQLAGESRLVYFVLFGALRTQEMVQAITQYLRSCEALSPEALLSPWHPFWYGVQALAEITGDQVPMPARQAALGNLEEFLGRITDWYEARRTQ